MLGEPKGGLDERVVHRTHQPPVDNTGTQAINCDASVLPALGQRARGYQSSQLGLCVSPGPVLLRLDERRVVADKPDVLHV